MMMIMMARKMKMITGKSFSILIQWVKNVNNFVDDFNYEYERLTPERFKSR